MSNIIYGKNPAIEFLRTKPRQIEKIYIYNNLEQSPSVQEIFDLVKKNKITFIRVDKNKLNSLAEGGLHQGVIIQTAGEEYSQLKDIFERAGQKNEQPFILMLDSISDPHNFGSIIRTAECAGAHGIIISKRNCVGLTPAVVKVSSGASAHIPIVKVSNLNYTIEDLKKENIWVAGADANAKKSYTEIDYKMPLVLVLGSEGAGISHLLKKSCDFLVKIPQRGKVSSLNVGVSAGILIYEVIRQRNLLT